MPDDNHQPEVPKAAEVYSSTSQPYGSQESLPESTQAVATVPPPPAPVVFSPPPPPPPPPPGSDDDDDESPEDKGMLRMSFMEHLEELRARLMRAIVGVVVAFVLSLTFCKPLWNIVSAPAVDALKHLGLTPKLIYTAPMDGFNIIYIKLPLLMSIFVGAPWILYQVWAFISPGLYKREKRWAVPFVTCTAGLFIAGGCFAYFVAFKFGLEFLLGIGRDINVSPMVTINEYFDLFVNVTLGVGLVFELPIVIFFLTLLRLASPRFLMRHSRYAILGIAILAAAVTPTPDAFNMMLFAVPMVLLYFVGVFASYLLVLKREGKSFPWRYIVLGFFGVLALLAGMGAIMVYHFHYHVVQHWPYLLK
jgi:sec-independent protein translocase protein TatC